MAAVTWNNTKINPCVECQCSNCVNPDCPVPCKSFAACKAPVTECYMDKPKKKGKKK